MTGPQQRSDAGAKVTVACRLPAGLEIRGYVKGTEREAVLGGGTREYDVYRWNGEEAHIYGVAVPYGQQPKCQMVAGFAITPNVSKDLWDNWYSANKANAYVRNNLVFAYEGANRTHDMAKENKDAVSGFEPIDPANPGKKVRGIVKADVK